MSRIDFLARLRRWLATRPGRLVLAGVGGFAALAVASIDPTAAHAQVPSVTAPAPAASPVAAPHPEATPPAPAHPAATATGIAFPTAHPPAETAATAGAGAHPSPHGAPDPHAAAPHGAAPHGSASAHGAGYHAPADFNFADIARYQAEKEKAARGEKEHGQPIVPVTPYAYLLINAAVLFYIYYRAGKKPIGDGLQARHDTVAKELAESAQIKAEAEARLAEYTTRLETLEEELQRIKGDIIKAGEGDRARIVKEAEEKAERMKKDAAFLLDQEMKQLRLDMIAYTVEAASTAAEQVLKSRIGSSDHDRLADEYVKQLAQNPSAPSSRSTGGAS